MSIDSQQLLLLLNWMSPAFPTGAFAYSHGLEQAIADGRLHDAGSVEAWIADLLGRGSGWNDAVLFARCWKDDISELNDLALALAPSKERYEETVALGKSFEAAAAVWRSSSSQREASPPPPLTLPHTRFARGGEEIGSSSPRSVRRVRVGVVQQAPNADVAHPIAAARACIAMGVPCEAALLAYLNAFSQTLVSVAVRLVPLGQSAGLDVLRNLAPLIAATASRAGTAELSDLGSACIGADIAAMKHEILEPRIFRT